MITPIRILTIGAIAAMPFVFTACQGMGQPVDAKERRAEFIENTNVPKNDAYKRALAYFGKSIVNSNVAIKMQDPAEGRILLKSGTSCPELKSSLDMTSYTLTYNIDFQAKDNKVRVIFDDMLNEIKGAPAANAQLTNAIQVEKAKKCVAKIKEELIREIASTNPANNKDW